MIYNRGSSHECDDVNRWKGKVVNNFSSQAVDITQQWGQTHVLVSYAYSLRWKVAYHPSILSYLKSYNTKI